MLELEKVKDANSDKKIAYKDFKDEILKFSAYDSTSRLLYDECFWFTYKSLKDIKSTFIILSYLRQIEAPIEEIKSIYGVDDNYIQNLVIHEMPLLRVKAYRRLQKIPKGITDFSKEWHPTLAPSLKELIDRLEYLIEVSKNQNKIKSELGDNIISQSILNNPSVLVLLNHFSLKDTLIISTNLDLLDVDEDVIYELYPFTESDFRELFKSSSIDDTTFVLNKRIKKLKAVKPNTSFFNYQELLDNYQDLLERITDTKEYLSNLKQR